MNHAPKSLEEAIRQQAQAFLSHRNASYQDVGEKVLSELPQLLAVLAPFLSPERGQERRPLLEAILQQQNYRIVALDMLSSDKVLEPVGLNPQQMLWNAIAYNVCRHIDDWQTWGGILMGGYFENLPMQLEARQKFAAMTRLEYLIVVDAEVSVAQELVAVLAAARPDGTFDFTHYQYIRS